MKRIVAGCLAGVICLACPFAAVAQKKAKETYNPATPQDYAQLNKVPELQAKLLGADLGSQTVSIRVEYQHWEPNPNFKQSYGGNKSGGFKSGGFNQAQQMQSLQRQIASARTPQQKQRVMMQMQQQMARMQQQYLQQYAKQIAQAGKNAGKQNNNGPFRLATDSKDFELPMSDKVVTRRLSLPQEYDNKGNLKQFTKEEAEALRGKDKTKPGFMAKFEDLLPGQVVKLSLAAAKAAPAKAGKDDDEAVLGDGGPRPTVTIIVIVNETPDPKILPPDNGKKKKK